MGRKNIIKIGICIVAVIVVAFMLYSLGGDKSGQMGTRNTVRMAMPPQPGMLPANFQKEHKYTAQLMKIIMNIGNLEESGKAPLSKAQAQKILAIIEPLRKKDALSELDARDAVVKLQEVLTDEQKAAINSMPERGGSGPMSPQNGMPGGAPPMNPGPGRQFGPPRGAMNPPKGFNPLNPPAEGPDGESHPDRISEIIEKLSAKSKGK